MEQVDMLTIKEYRLLMKAYELKQVDIDFRLHELAFLNTQAGAKKKSGKNLKLVFSRFEKFFNYEKEIEKVMNKDRNKKRRKGISEFFRKEVDPDG